MPSVVCAAAALMLVAALSVTTTAAQTPSRPAGPVASTVTIATVEWIEQFDPGVLASGPGKAEALRASLDSGDQTPLGRVLRMRGQTKIFTDIVLAETVEKAGLYPKKILLKKI